MSEVRTKKSLLQSYQDAMPRGAGALCLIQLFSTLSYSVLYSTLILYMTKGMGMSDLLATSLTGSFIALNYFLHLLGGYIGGRYLSYRALFSIGMLAQIVGCLLISIPNPDYLLWGLASFLSGSGLNITCINCMVTQLFEPNDKRRETAFFWNYSGMNVGFFIGFSLGGYFHLHHAYQQLFILSAVGNVAAFALMLYHWKKLGDRNTTFTDVTSQTRKTYRLIGVSMVVTLILALRFLLNQTELCNQLIMAIGAAMLGFLIFSAVKEPHEEARKKLWGFIILALSAIIFWALYQLAPMGLNLFIERNVDRHFLGFLIAPQWIQNINAIVIIFGGPILSVMFLRMRERGVNLNLPLQFSLALLMIGVAFAILPLGIHFADSHGYVSIYWIIACYILQSLGELFISPVGYAMVGQLAPVHLRGLLMGIWMMIMGVASVLSSHFSKVALGANDSIDPLTSNASYSHTFGMLGFSAICVGTVLFFAIPYVTRLTREKRDEAVTENSSLCMQE